MKHQHARGFTLVELLVAVGIIGVLASVSVVSVNSVRAKGRDAKRVQEAKQIQNALEAFFASNNSYPLGRAAAAEINLGVASNPAVATDPLVMCTIDSTADANIVADAYGGLGFRQDTTASANGTAGCIGSPTMAKVPRDQDSSKNYKYKATDCAVDGGGAAISPCAGYTLKVTFEGRTGDFAAGERTFTQTGVQ